MRPAYIEDHQDGITAIINTTNEDHLIRFNTAYQLPDVKQEPFEYADHHYIHHPILEYPNYTTANYANMIPMTTVSTAPSMVTSTSSTTTQSTDASSTSPVLPLCPAPTEKTVDHFYNSTIVEMSKSLPDESTIARIFAGSKGLKNETHSFAVYIADENLKLIVDWAKNNDLFAKLQLDDQMNLLQTSWSTVHMVDLVNAMVHGNISPVYKLASGEDVSVAAVALLGNLNFVNGWNDLVVRLRSMGFNNFDYCAFRYLALFDQSMDIFLPVASARSKILHAWAEVRFTYLPAFLDIFDQIRRLSYDSVQYLWSLQSSFPEMWMSLKPDASLVLEMIKTSATRAANQINTTRSSQVTVPLQQSTYQPVVYMTS